MSSLYAKYMRAKLQKYFRVIYELALCKICERKSIFVYLNPSISWDCISPQVLQMSCEHRISRGFIAQTPASNRYAQGVFPSYNFKHHSLVCVPHQYSLFIDLGNRFHFFCQQIQFFLEMSWHHPGHFSTKRKSFSTTNCSFKHSIWPWFIKKALVADLQESVKCTFLSIIQICE